ncbi:27413_t:CDS:2 [Dentiscutata erythropus]|uniref:27413_t:CDS:1 n=1 Tax=Dentiscutata erythropus TaxID=1348616 RepID=A0A9N9NIY6_9GLOM|nr:27413_t:CDS:2 [Dentiscutata erythropus]
MEDKDSFGHTEEFSNIELDIDDWINIVDKLSGQIAGCQNELNHIELYNKNLTNATNEPAAKQTIINFNNRNKNSTNIMNEPAVRQIVGSQDELNRIESHNKNLVNVINELAVGQTFGSWNELDCFISFYTKLQNFGHNSTNKTSIAENQRQTRICLNHNDHQISDETNKFALKYRIFSESMLKEIKFWTEVGNINMRTQYQILVKQYPDAATLLNNLLEHKSKDSRWIVK